MYTLGFSENFSLLKVNEGNSNGYQQFFLGRPLFEDVRDRENCAQRSDRICDWFRLQLWIYDEMVKMSTIIFVINPGQFLFNSGPELLVQKIQFRLKALRKFFQMRRCWSL